MRITGVIPARYSSSRFPGKPLADLLGKPMIKWVHERCSLVEEINKLIIATDDERILKVCLDFNLPCVMTSPLCKTSTERVYEVAKNNPSDLYIVINGDEPLIDPNVISAIIPGSISNDCFIANLMTKIKSPAELVDPSNIKVVTDDNGYALYMSRSPIPHPKSSVMYDYYKHVGVLAYNFSALEFFYRTERGFNESIEDINELRFIEHGKRIKMVEVDSDSLSVDTPKDLEKVISIIKNSKDCNMKGLGVN